jgi:[protein-PII] uridylyltransferase
VLDVFTVRSPANGAPADEAEEAAGEEGAGDVWATFAADLEQALRGTLAVPELVRRHTRPSGLPPRKVPRVETVVTVDNAISERLTVIDVQAPDRLGVLYAITRALSEQGLTIHVSRVNTEAGRVVDIFYVSDRDGGGKVTDAARLAEVRRAVQTAIAALAPEER